MKALIYARVSTEEQAENETIQIQLEQYCRPHAKARGYEVVGEYLDDGVSGAVRFHQRPGGAALLDRLQQGGVDVVVVKNTDRFSRDEAVYYEAKGRVQTFAPVEYVEQEFDDTPTGHAFEGMNVVMNAWERRVIRQRTMDGRRRRVAQGKYMAPYPPYGYDYDRESGLLVVNEDEAKWLRLMFQWADEGAGGRTIARRLNELGVDTPSESPSRAARQSSRSLPEVAWGITSINNYLKARRYTGEGTYGGESMKYPPIIDLDLFERVIAGMKTRKHVARRNTRGQYLLDKLIYCRHCSKQKAMAGSEQDIVFRSETPKGRYQHYVCGMKRAHPRQYLHEGIPWRFYAHELDPFIKQTVFEMLMDPHKLFADAEFEREELSAKLAGGGRRIREVESEIAKLKKRRAGYQDQAADGLMSRDELRARLAENEQQITDLERELAGLKEDAIVGSERARLDFLNKLASIAGTGRRPARAVLVADANGNPRLKPVRNQREEEEATTSTTFADWHRWVRFFIKRIWVEEDGTLTVIGHGDIELEKLQTGEIMNNSSRC